VSINLRTGQPGHGKSYGCVRVIRDSLERGEYVATNIRLIDERTEEQIAAGEPPTWARIMARTNLFRRLIPGRWRAMALRFVERVYFIEDLAELQKLRLPPCGKCRGCRKGPGCQKEGRGRAVLDEAHQWLNARTWDVDETGQASTKAEGVKRRLSIVKFFATHRHRGWHIELITQDEGNLDRQVRGLFEYHTHLKNLRRYKVLGLFPIVPVNVFVAVTHWHDNEKSRLGVETYLLNKKLARCYDTFGAARDLDEDPDAIWLGPRPVSGERGRSPAAASEVDAPAASFPVATPTAASDPARWPEPFPGSAEGGPSEPPEILSVAMNAPLHAASPGLTLPSSPAVSADASRLDSPTTA